MKVILDRQWKKDKYTISRVFIDGDRFCECIEDKDRGLKQYMSEGEIAKIKVYGETAIPSGEYKVTMTYSNKYKRIMPQVMNVKGFTGIRIHSGNSQEDSLGCLIFGRNTKPGWVSESRVTCNKFEELLLANGGTCDLEIL